ncbi:hypothetical protein CYMTET_17867 [Cymbomonas tetramitiformis]|uniref:FZ domain-containing protein n=1 Tax=Cymbomonas tetramitiformis TaxID=36881 RepID=A0AAE0L6U9_9CHLO|nr:hypothetical protein CYMTET_17867 [Cymbomonas tetramitiformis]
MGEAKFAIPNKDSLKDKLHKISNVSLTRPAGTGSTSRDDSGSQQPGIKYANQLKMVANLPPKQQRLVLAGIGLNMQKKQQSDCNIFGGAADCKSLPADSDFARMCPNHPLTSDCVYYNEELVEIEDDPMTDLKAEMEEQGDEQCERCLHHEQELWCAGAVPPCGSFQQHVEVAILPAMVQLIDAREQGSSVELMTVVAQAIPTIMQTMSLSMPCREMCYRVINTCGCGKEHTFGSLISSLQENTDDENERKLPSGIGEKIFSKVWDVPICNLYSPANSSDFTGACIPADGVLDEPCSWCGSDNDLSTFVEMQLAGQFAEQVYGWVAGPLGLMDVADEFVGSEEYNDVSDYVDDEGDEGDADDIIIVLVVVGLLLLIGGVASFLFIKTDTLKTLFGRLDDTSGTYRPVNLDSDGLLSPPAATAL